MFWLMRVVMAAISGFIALVAAGVLALLELLWDIVTRREDKVS